MSLQQQFCSPSALGRAWSVGFFFRFGFPSRLGRTWGVSQFFFVGFFLQAIFSLTFLSPGGFLSLIFIFGRVFHSRFCFFGFLAWGVGQFFFLSWFCVFGFVTTHPRKYRNIA
jgi:hypothetical protein